MRTVTDRQVVSEAGTWLCPYRRSDARATGSVTHSKSDPLEGDETRP